MSLESRTALFVLLAVSLVASSGCKSSKTAPKSAIGAPTVTVGAMPRFGGGGSGSGCPGTYQAYARFPDLGGTLTWTAPAGSRSCRISDVTPEMPSTYVVRVEAVKGLTQVACGNRSASFPVTAGSKYTFTSYVLNYPPPPSGLQSMELQVEWLP